VTEIAWDDNTIKWIAENEFLNVRLTHMSKTMSLGQRHSREERWYEPDWSACGVMTSPKLIPVGIRFSNREHDEHFGGFSYDRRDNKAFNERIVNLPFLNVWLSDRDGHKRQVLHSALQDALVGGWRSTGVRFWKEKGQGLMTELDKHHGYSYESSYVIFGMTIWPTLQARCLPRWAVPTDDIDFSLNALPNGVFEFDRELD
jgi:hypothetical protein